MAQTTIVGVARELKARKKKLDNRLDEANAGSGDTDTGSATTFPTSSNSAGAKRNKQFLKDKAKLDSLSRKDIEALRTKLIAEREAKKKKKVVPLF